jgi:hypothetical protein
MPKFFGNHGVFEAGQCWLRPGARPLDWIAVKQKLPDRIVGQGVGIIAVRVAGGDAIYALPKKIKAAMNNFAGLSRVANTCIDTLGQGQLVINSFQENGATIGTAVGLVKGNSIGFVKFVAPDREVFF